VGESLNWQQLAESVRSNKAGEAIAQQNANTNAAGNNPDGTPVYDPKGDLSILTNSGAASSATDLASLRLIVGTGALNADNFATFVDGQEYWAYVDDAGKTQYVYSEDKIPQTAKNLFHWKSSAVPTTSGKFAGIMSMSDTTFESVLKLATDPTMAVALATVKDMADHDTKVGSDWVTIANAYIKAYGLGSEVQSGIHDLLRTYFGSESTPVLTITN
jgi:hypothetical protein